MKFQRGGVTIERQVRLSGAGGVALRQRFTGNGERVIVTHAASLVATVTVLGATPGEYVRAAEAGNRRDVS